MCQQTQVGTVIPYYERWMLRFPTINELARADLQEVLSFWQGLGYYRRAENLKRGAELVTESGFPQCYSDWLKIPGVGAYTAAAIASICLEEPRAVVDGNVERVYSRLLADKSNGAQLKAAAQKWGDAHINQHEPGNWNQALMELGATICTPTQPKCESCPVSSFCLAYKQNIQRNLPFKLEKNPTETLKFWVYIPLFKGKLGIQPVTHESWWRGLYEFPRFDSSIELPGKLQQLQSLKHTVTRYKLEINPKIWVPPTQTQGLIWVLSDELPKYPLSALATKLLKLDEVFAPFI